MIAPLRMISGQIAPFHVIVINTLCARIRQYNALGHELAHVFLDHHHQPGKHVMQLEAEANLYAWDYYRMYRDGKLQKPERISIG